MTTIETVGAWKSCAYVLILTFFLPLGVVQVSNTLFAAVSQGSDKIVAFFISDPAATPTLSVACPDQPVVRQTF